MDRGKLLLTVIVGIVIAVVMVNSGATPTSQLLGSEYDNSEMEEKDEPVYGPPAEYYKPPNSPIYALLESNISSRGDGRVNRIPMWTLSTNSRGLREDEFRTQPPSDTVRILLIGDSLTMGSGVNRSQRYGDIVEQRLNSSLSCPVQIINAAVPGWGAKDYYLFFRERGIKYRPDILVVAIGDYDVYSRKQHDQFQQKARNMPETTTEEEVSEKTAELVREYVENLTWARSPIRRNLLKIHALALNQSIDSFVYGQYNIVGLRSDHSFPSWAESQNISYIPTSEKVRNRGWKEVRISPTYGHYTPEAHRWAAEPVYNTLRDHILETTSCELDSSGG